MAWEHCEPKHDDSVYDQVHKEGVCRDTKLPCFEDLEVEQNKRDLNHAEYNHIRGPGYVY